MPRASTITLDTASSLESQRADSRPGHLARPGAVPPARPSHDEHGHDDDEDEDDVESLLYLAQMALIVHKEGEAVTLLERAADAGSSAACATLAGLLNRKSRLASPMQTSHHHSLPALSLSPSSATATTGRPLPPPRKESFTVAHTAQKRTPDALRALELSLRGLDLLLAKPVRHLGDSGYADPEDDEDSAEGEFFDAERALDFIVRVTDAHRFGVLHSPSLVPEQLPSPPAETSTLNNDLWHLSAAASANLLDHESVAPLLQASSEPPQPTFLSRSLRSSSVSRAYNHPSSTVPLGTSVTGSAGALLASERKIKVTVAIHALYVLAVQAWTLQPASVPAPPPSTGLPLDLGSHPQLLAERYWSTIVGLASPYAAFGGIGIKEGDELVERTRCRLESLHHQDMGPEEPWRLAKKRGRQHPPLANGVVVAAQDPSSSSPEAVHEMGSSAVTIRSMLSQAPSSVTGSYSGRTPRAGAPKFHFGADVEEIEEDHLASASSGVMPAQASTPTAPAELAHSPPFSLSPPRDLLSSAGMTSPPRDALLASAQQYPSPPDTPPIASASNAFYPNFSHGRATTSSLSPPSSSARLAPLGPPHASSSDLPRVTSTRSIASQRSTTSVLSNFRHDPLQAYLFGRLRRVTSSTSVCTAPPDLLGRTRVCRGKGKGKMVEPEPSELFDLRALKRARSRPALATVEETVAQPRTWLSRFWETTRTSLDRVPGLSALAEEDTVDRTRSSSAVHALRKALDRHDSAGSAIQMYWGDDGDSADEVDVDEIVGLEDDHTGSRPAKADLDKLDSPPSPHGASSLRFDTPQLSRADKLRSSLTAKDPSSRRAARQRSFLLTDPTSVPASAGSSRERSRSRKGRSREVSATSSISSTYSTTADGHLAPPSPATRRRRGQHSPATAAADECEGEGEREVRPVAMDPLLLELERRSHIGLKTVCAACGRRGLNFPACRRCKETYCSRECRVGGRERHVCRGTAATKRA